jgi:hypothetical protein
LAKRSYVPPTASDDEVRSLLARYECPLPFHQVRTLFLGNIASPSVGLSPIRVIERLWGGELPEFDSIDEANELIGALVMGLWNRLTRHQDRSEPFRLTRIQTDPTRERLATLAVMRRQELDGFVEGLFGTEKSINLPERTHRALHGLGEMRAGFAAMFVLASDQGKEANIKDVERALRNSREMTKIAEREMHTVVLSCARARRELMAMLPTDKPTVH